MKSYLIASIFTILISFSSMAQVKTANHIKFWKQLEKHCGKAYKGKVATAPVPEDFQLQELQIHFKACGEGQIKIPLIVGENRSRTWILTLNEQNIQLKHDYRKMDGKPDSVTMYGGTSVNTGFESMQFFPADQETVDMMPYSAANIWWISITDSTLSYNLRRVNSNELIKLKFDLTEEIEKPAAPWGWEE